MTDNKAVIKVAKWVGWAIHKNDWDEVTINRMVLTDIRVNQLLMLAVLEKMGWGSDYDTSGGGLGSFKNEVGSWSKWMPKADLPLAVIRACAERIEG